VVLTATVVCLALSLGAVEDSAFRDEPTNVELKPANSVRPPPAAVNFDELPPVVVIEDDQRVKRFLGALTGGVVGLGASLALMPIGDSVGCFGGPCVSFIHGMLGTLAPLLAVGGAWLGFELMGGDGGLVTPAVALGPALLIGLVLSNVARETNADTALALLPYVIASGAFLVGGAALALDARARQLNGLGGAASWGKATAGRVAMTSLVSLLSGGGAALVSGLLFAIGQFSALGPVLLVVGALSGLVGTAAATWGVHRAMNGRGSFGSALLGLSVGATLFLGALGLYAGSVGGFSFNPVRDTASVLMMIELGVAAALFAPTLALEFSHTSTIEASLPKFTIGAAPTANGGMVAAGMRF
jgi:hypothetical protein